MFTVTCAKSLEKQWRDYRPGLEKSETIELKSYNGEGLPLTRNPHYPRSSPPIIFQGTGTIQ